MGDINDHSVNFDSYSYCCPVLSTVLLEIGGIGNSGWAIVAVSTCNYQCMGFAVDGAAAGWLIKRDCHSGG